MLQLSAYDVHLVYKSSFGYSRRRILLSAAEKNSAKLAEKFGWWVFTASAVAEIWVRIKSPTVACYLDLRLFTYLGLKTASPRKLEFWSGIG